jgi:hypothetical protein
MLCKYKNALGKPDVGIHSYRIFNIAIADVILTILAALLISWAMKLNFLGILIILFLLGIILHKIFCVKTTVDKLIFQ